MVEICIPTVGLWVVTFLDLGLRCMLIFGLWVCGVCCIPMLISRFVVYVDLWVCGLVVYVV